MNPFDHIKFMDRLHQGAPIEASQEILFRGAMVGDLAFLPLFRECLDRSGTPVGSWKTFRRAQRALTLARYFDHSLAIEGARAECGMFRGFSALLLAKIAGMRDPDFKGRDLHLVDSFEGLSPPAPQDAIGSRKLPTGEEHPVYSHGAGHFSTPPKHVRQVLADFPDVTIHKGWIPEALSALPETKWSFVHIDVDLYEPTKGCLEYFAPRLAAGGVIVNDDFASPLFPGGGHGWNDYFQALGLSYIVLDTGQAIYLKGDA